jgi:hypothetical protein
MEFPRSFLCHHEEPCSLSGVEVIFITVRGEPVESRDDLSRYVLAPTCHPGIRNGRIARPV